MPPSNKGRNKGSNRLATTRGDDILATTVAAEGAPAPTVHLPLRVRARAPRVDLDRVPDGRAELRLESGAPLAAAVEAGVGALVRVRALAVLAVEVGRFRDRAAPHALRLVQVALLALTRARGRDPCRLVRDRIPDRVLGRHL